jgi:hypothetical protein
MSGTAYWESADKGKNGTAAVRKGVKMAMKFKYVRIQGTELAENTMYAKGIFSMCVQLARNDVMDAEDKELFQEIDSWIAEVLPFPPQCRRQENVVCFFKTEKETEMMRMIHPLMWLLEKYHHPFFVVYTNSPGEIVYEDEYQVAVKVPGFLQIDKIPESWSPKEID